MIALEPFTVLEHNHTICDCPDSFTMLNILRLAIDEKNNDAVTDAVTRVEASLRVTVAK